MLYKVALTNASLSADAHTHTHTHTHLHTQNICRNKVNAMLKNTPRDNTLGTELLAGTNFSAFQNVGFSECLLNYF